MPQTFSQYFKLNKSQLELDFVDIIIDGRDNAFFIDPFVISNISDDWSISANNKISVFFEKVIHYIKSGNDQKARKMLDGFHEPKETRFGFSINSANGRSVSGEKSGKIFEALSNSKVIKSGLIKHIEETQLMIEGIGEDNISDIVTMIIKDLLVEYTNSQCKLHSIEVKKEVAGGQFWNENNEIWTDEYVTLPIINNKQIILVPKKVAKFAMSINAQEYHDFYTLTYLQKKYENPALGLARILQNGTIKVYKKDIKEKKLADQTLKKSNYNITFEESTLLDNYRNDKMNGINKSGNAKLKDPFNLKNNEEIDNLIKQLKNIETGTKFASDYHNLMIGILEVLFYPSLSHFEKEVPVDNGRKRIDIVAANSAKKGFFSILSNKNIPSGHIFFECKNYTSEIANPELDQMNGRFHLNRGKLGFILCRKLNNKRLFWERCKDIANGQQHFIFVLDDEDIVELLTIKKSSEDEIFDKKLNEYYKKLIFNL